MNDRENSILKKRLISLEGIIRDNEKLPKEKRNHHAVTDAKNRATRIKQWMRGKEDPKPEPQPLEIIYKTTPHKPASIMVIEKIEDLHTAWSNLWKKNVGVQGPPEVLQELRDMVLLYRDREKTFASMPNPTHFITGEDNHGIKWTACWRMNYSNADKVRNEVEAKIGQKLSEWNSFKIDKVNSRVAGRR
jgi:hypothetical protein